VDQFEYIRSYINVHANGFLMENCLKFSECSNVIEKNQKYFKIQSKTS